MGVVSFKALSTSTGAKTTKFWDQKRTDIVASDSLTCYLNAGNTTSYSGSGTSWTDLSGNGNHFTIYGSPSYTSGSSGYFTFPAAYTVYAHREYLTNFKAQTFSMGMWVYFADTNRSIMVCLSRVGNKSTKIDRASEDAATEGIWSKESSGYMQYWDYDSGYSFQNVTQTGSTLSTGQWYYLSWTRSGITGKMYVNGTLTNSFTSLKDGWIGPNDWVIGKDFRDNWDNTGSGMMSGRIAQFQLWNKALSDSEVAQNFSLQRSIYGV